MSQSPEQVSVPPAHSGEDFIDFAYDMLQYTITKKNLQWIEPFDYERKTAKVFEESFGDAVILYHQKHIEQFDSWGKDDDIEAIKLYVEVFCERAFKGYNLMREFIRYCALLFDIGSYEIEYFNHFYIIHEIADEISGVFDTYLKPRFTKVGGWEALFREADEYVIQVTLSDSSVETTDDSDESFII